MNCPNCKKPADIIRRTMFLVGDQIQVYYCQDCRLATVEGSDEPWVSMKQPFEMMSRLEAMAYRVEQRRATARLVRYQDLETK